MSNTNAETADVVWTPARERFLLLTLAAIQFTTILDFLIIIPLGPQYMEVFHISIEQFQLIVGAYGISAGVAGLVASFFLDRFDRKSALVFLYAGFTIGTLFCAMAPTYQLLVAARFFAGAFGGVCGTVILSIVGDVIPMVRRGRAMGLVMSSFSVSSIVGVPAGLYVAARSSWHVPFYAIAVMSAVVWVIAVIVTPPLRDHLKHATDEHPVARVWAVIKHPDHQKSYIFMAALTCAGFCIFSYIPTYMVTNVGMTQDQLPLIYLVGGLCTVFSMNWIGRLADHWGKLRVFTIISCSTAAPILLVTNLPRVSLVAAIAVSTLVFVCMSGRMVPAMALMTGAVEARYRGGFMSVNSSVQQFTMGVTAYFTGKIIGTGQHGEMTNFPINGIISIACMCTCIYLARFLKMPAHSEASVEPVFSEMG
jgi:predicted MFS family arabinose efflux permease